MSFASIEEKGRRLEDLLSSLGSSVLALSGGVDSGLLLSAAAEALGKDVQAVTVAAPYVPKAEREEARRLAETVGAELRVLQMELPKGLKDNPQRRCYLCKMELFTRIGEFARQSGAAVILEGSNADDLKAYRPGRKAIEELGVRSPLAELGITKQEVRELARRRGLAVWNKPAYSCLLTRLAHGSEVSAKLLQRVERAEELLRERGFAELRVRVHGEIARIEVGRDERGALCETETMDLIDEALKRLGFSYVTVDLGGYRSGSMDPIDAVEREE
jgi:pyridinium-3,5-biscarboxylic acid mononucleotide sulfurtransferase